MNPPLLTREQFADLLHQLQTEQETAFKEVVVTRSVNEPVIQTVGEAKQLLIHPATWSACEHYCHHEPHRLRKTPFNFCGLLITEAG